MVFKKSLSALVLGMNLLLILFRKNTDVLTIIAASPSHVRSTAACNFLEPIKTDLLENFFENECGDLVSILPPYYYKYLC